MKLKHLQINTASVKATGAGRQFTGYASVFGGVDSYGDTVFPGAYADTIANRERPIALRWNHYGPVIGKWLTFEEDETGLKVTGELTEGHSVADDAYALLKHGAISGLSIGYYPVEYEDNDTGGVDLKKIELVEISVVETPADNSAHVSDVKSALAEAESIKEIERVLRDAGHFSRQDAQTIISRIKSLSKPSVSPEQIQAAFSRLKI